MADRVVRLRLVPLPTAYSPDTEALEMVQFLHGDGV